MEPDASFGGWVRRRRKALDLLQKELADRAGCSLPALQKIERDERRPSRQLAERLAEALDVPLDQRPLFLQVARGERMTARLEPLPPPAGSAAPWALSPSPARPGPELPRPLTPIFGRRAELSEAAQLLRAPECRLLTLAGPGGIGKTRLALEVAYLLQGEFADGACFVPLASISAPAHVVPAIAAAASFAFAGPADPRAQLLSYLRERRLLLVLDNVEHLLGVADLIGAILVHAPDVKLCVTSREPLQLQAEWVLRVQGLPVPQSEQADALEASGAAALFLEYARHVQVGYCPSAEEIPALVRICQLVEGNPLALELAASWVWALSCREIADHLERSLAGPHEEIDVLTTNTRDVPERHRSMAAVFDQSWRLLDDAERHALRQLAVFRGGFTREAAREVAGAALPVLVALAAKSLLRRREDGRYELHELLRQYAAVRLREDRALLDAVEDRHCAYYLGLLERRDADLKGLGHAAAAADLTIEHENLRLAWSRAVAHRWAAGLTRAAGPLFWWYEARNLFQEGMTLFAEAADALRKTAPDATVARDPAGGAAEERDLALGHILTYQASFCLRCGQPRRVIALLHESLAVLRPMDESAAPGVRGAIAYATAFLGIVQYVIGSYDESERHLQESLLAMRAVGDRWGTALCVRQLGQLMYARGSYAEAHQLLQESLQLSRALGNPWSLAFSLNFLGTAAYALGSYGEAEQLLREGLAQSRKLNDRLNIAYALSGLGQVSYALGHLAEAQQYLDESLALSQAIGDRRRLAQALHHLGQVAAGLGEHLEAERRFLEALRVATEAEVTPLALDALLGIAELRLQAGAPEAAFELVTVIGQQEGRPQGVRIRAEQLGAELEGQLTGRQLRAAEERARARTLQQLTQELLTTIR